MSKRKESTCYYNGDAGTKQNKAGRKRGEGEEGRGKEKRAEERKEIRNHNLKANSTAYSRSRSSYPSSPFCYIYYRYYYYYSVDNPFFCCLICFHLSGELPLHQSEDHCEGVATLVRRCVPKKVWWEDADGWRGVWGSGGEIGWGGEVERVDKRSCTSFKRRPSCIKYDVAFPLLRK